MTQSQEVGEVIDTWRRRALGKFPSFCKFSLRAGFCPPMLDGKTWIGTCSHTGLKTEGRDLKATIYKMSATK